MKIKIYDHFTYSVKKSWNLLSSGSTLISINKSSIKLGYHQAESKYYSNAQLDDYTMLAPKKYKWEAPLKMSIKARFIFSENSENNNNLFQGTAGFGFWNNPCSIEKGLHSLPEAIWFFYASSYSQMSLIKNGKNNGWKAQIVHAKKINNILYFFPTCFSVIYAYLTNNINWASYWIEKFSGAQETIIHHTMYDWHIYTIEWNKHISTFFIDNDQIMSSVNPPSSKLGFVAWVDNQYSIISKKGTISFKTADSKSLILEIDYINIESTH